jgi:hypothetical protein
MSEPAQGAKDPHPALATIQNALPQAFDTAAEKWLAGPSRRRIEPWRQSQ